MVQVTAYQNSHGDLFLDPNECLQSEVNMLRVQADQAMAQLLQGTGSEGGPSVIDVSDQIRSLLDTYSAQVSTAQTAVTAGVVPVSVTP